MQVYKKKKNHQIYLFLVAGWQLLAAFTGKCIANDNFIPPCVPSFDNVEQRAAQQKSTLSLGCIFT